jgi:cysteine synthase
VESILDDRLADRLGPDAVIVTLAVDTGFKYLSVKPFGDD